MNNGFFSFNYGGTPFNDLTSEVSVSENGNVTKTTYKLDNTLLVTHCLTKYPQYDACEWVTWFENISDLPSKPISNLWDCDADIPLSGGIPFKYTAYKYNSDATKILAPRGSNWSYDEFYSDPDIMVGDGIPGHIYISRPVEYKNVSGRSSEDNAPFFNIFMANEGVIFAIGWSGTWNCRITRGEEFVNLKTKIDDVGFCLLPGEKIRTSSIVIMNYKGDNADGQNKWRRFVKEHISPVGKNGRPDKLPICAGIWGGMSDKDIFERLNIIEKNKLEYEYVWMDAGWYGGENVGESVDEFEGDWGRHTGDWRINSAHQNKLVDVTEKIRSLGMDFLLWFEPERVRCSTPVATQHPEYFFTCKNGGENMLLNLGDEKAWQYCFDMLSEHIDKLKIKFLRIDFNFEPSDFWRENESEQRRGINEIKYIMGLYRLWDELLAKFPGLLIDDCASGGRRIDIETMRRSVPLWRSDAACPADYPCNYNQNHNVSFGTWIPYSGTGTGRGYDLYRIRSAYAGGMTTNYSFSSRNSFADTPEKLELLQHMLEEYKRVRPYFYADLYPLTKVSENDDIWFAAQYNRPENGDGLLQVFRRENACGTSACYKLRGLKPEKSYTFTDADGGSSVTLSGRELAEHGIEISIDEPRTAKIYFYEEVQ